MTTSKRIQRSTVAGNLVTVDNPQFITLVKRPANQRSFSILRSEKEDGNVSTPNSKRVGRTRRNQGDDVKDLISISLPGTLDEAGAKQTLEGYGLGNFTVSRSEDDTAWVAQNPSAINCTDELTSVKLAEGVVAQVRRTEATAATEGKGQLAVTSFEFSGEQFADTAAVSEWCQRNSVDFDEKALNNPSGNLVLQRSEVPEGEETRLMELEEGVTATIIRSQVGDIPDGFVAVINEYAYCGWGWGQLDFTAALVGEQVGDALYEGLWVLEDLLRNILFWSELPVDVRKELTTRACGQFASYATGLLDTLPRQLLISVATTQRSAKENDMSTTAKPAASAAQRTEAQAPVSVVVGSPEFNSAVGDAVAAELAKRAEADQKAEAERVQREADEAKAKEAEEAKATVQRQELASAIAEAQAPLLEEIKQLRGTTIVRSENGDPVQAAPAKRSEGDIFRGCLGIQRADRNTQRAQAEAEGAQE